MTSVTTSMCTAAAQYREWCHYLFDHGTLLCMAGQAVKWIFGLPLRFRGTAPVMLTTESPLLLDHIRKQLASSINKLGPLHDKLLQKRKHCELQFEADVIMSVTFVTTEEVAISILVAPNKTLKQVHELALMYHVYLNWLLPKNGLVLLEWTITFSFVYASQQLETDLRQQLLQDAEWIEAQNSSTRTLSKSTKKRTEEEKEETLVEDIILL